VVNFASNAWFIILIIGTSMSYMGLVRFAIILYAATVVFQLVTLPVEIDASRRAVAFLGAQGSAIDQEGAKQVLTAAALTYVAAALASLLQLVYLLMRTERD
jgi:Zn-dependent membrane protease YugP